jgi:hypothetical protein
MRKSNWLHSSERRFSSGVPVSARRQSAFSTFTACAVAESAFLMFCASSRMTSRYSRPSSSFMSRRMREYEVSTTSTPLSDSAFSRRSCPCQTTVESVGANRWISRSQFASTLVGATTIDGLGPSSAFVLSSSVIACTVLPRPMSSASTPDRPWR